jgi:Tfp pilus assembly protein PilF
LLHAKAQDAQAIEAAMARKLIEKSLAIDATNAGAHVELATLLERLRAYPEAAAEFERAATLDSRDAATHYHLARLYDRLNRPEDAAAQRQLHAQLTAAQDALR